MHVGIALSVCSNLSWFIQFETEPFYETPICFKVFIIFLGFAIFIQLVFYVSLHKLIRIFFHILCEEAGLFGFLNHAQICLVEVY